MVAAATLGDIVEQAGEVENLPAREVGNEPRAERILVRMLRLGETAQVADDHQNVLVHRVHVEEVMLHLADNAAESGKVIAENAVLVHPPQLVRLTARLAENLQEALPVSRIAAEPCVDAIVVSPKRTQGPCRHSLELGMPLHREKGVEHRFRPALEQRFVTNIEQLVDDGEIVIDGNRLGGNRKQTRMQILQQDYVDLPDELRRAIVALHQLLARPFRRRIGETELPRQRILQIEHEAILAAAGGIMETNAPRADETFLPPDRD